MAARRAARLVTGPRARPALPPPAARRGGGTRPPRRRRGARGSRAAPARAGPARGGRSPSARAAPRPSGAKSRGATAEICDETSSIRLWWNSSPSRRPPRRPGRSRRRRARGVSRSRTAWCSAARRAAQLDRDVGAAAAGELLDRGTGVGRTDRVGRAERPRELQPARDCVDGDHRGAVQPRELRRDQRPRRPGRRRRPSHRRGCRRRARRSARRRRCARTRRRAAARRRGSRPATASSATTADVRWPQIPHTRSPGASRPTPAPTATTSPTSS